MEEEIEEMETIHRLSPFPNAMLLIIYILMLLIMLTLLIISKKCLHIFGC